MRPCTTRYEVLAQGFDPAVAGVGGDGTGVQNVVGLRVPTLATSTPANRYLFVCAAKRLARKECVRVVGVRPLVEIGVDTNNGVPPIYAVTKQVTTPDWHFADTGPVCFSLRVHRFMPSWKPSNVLDTDSFAQSWTGGSPGLVYQTATFPAKNLDIHGHPDDYVALSSYTPPWSGMALGQPLAGFGDMREVRPYSDQTKQSLDPVTARGPGWLILWASVQQTNPEPRPTITLPTAMPLNPGIPEEGFVSTFPFTAGVCPGAVYWRVGGALVIEQVDADRRAA